MCQINPAGDRLPLRLSNLELHWTMGYGLHGYYTGEDASTLGNITDSQTDQVATSKPAIDCKVEKRSTSSFTFKLQTATDRPHFL